MRDPFSRIISISCYPTSSFAEADNALSIVKSLQVCHAGVPLCHGAASGTKARRKMTRVCTENSNPDVMMVKPAEDWG
jgi:hypothetical protein